MSYSLIDIQRFGDEIVITVKSRVTVVRLCTRFENRKKFALCRNIIYFPCYRSLKKKYSIVSNFYI